MTRLQSEIERRVGAMDDAYEQGRAAGRAEAVAELRSEADKAYSAARVQDITQDECDRLRDQGDLLFEMAEELAKAATAAQRERARL